MLNSLLATFYERDIRKLIEEVNLFSKEEDLWKTRGSVKNSSGNLVLHLIGGLNYLIGTTLAQTGYVRNRDQELQKRSKKKIKGTLITRYGKRITHFLIKELL